MTDLSDVFFLAISLVLSGNNDLLEIVALSLRVSLTAVGCAVLVGMPLGAAVGLGRFPGKNIIVLFFNAMMGIPPVVVGLFVYMMVSKSGPLGWLDILYTPTAMITAQFILITPIIASLTRQVIEDLHQHHAQQFRSLCVPRHVAILELLREGRTSLLTTAMAGLGRAMAEVGAVIIVGGNINHLTRVMTTAIALETSKGDLALALALGIVLLAMSLIINSAVMGLRNRAPSVIGTVS
ncbi:MAG: putative anion ABC transporter permease protein HVO [Magnetococcales bacterium]|nr:putative anion ABC transporter permease protein HVO [Magnetococcales bacterium]HIJ85686.1 ABC transporter permease [Magnetococcales bacterium]